MKVKELRCPYCKAPITIIDVDLNRSKCEYCGSYFAVEKENETVIDKYYRAFRENQKRQDEYYSSEEYKKAKMIRDEEERKETTKILFIIGILLALGIIGIILSS